MVTIETDGTVTTQKIPHTEVEPVSGQGKVTIRTDGTVTIQKLSRGETRKIRKEKGHMPAPA